MSAPTPRITHVPSNKESAVNLIKSIEQRCFGSMRVPGHGMVYAIDIDRSLAESMVSSIHRSQRRTRPHAITRLVAEMSEGRWMWNGSTIALSADGQLVDGQHRMRAVALSGVTMRSALVVVREDHLSPLEIVTDVGTARTAIDFRNEKMGNSLAAGILYEYVGMPLNGNWISGYSQHQRAVIQDACPFVDGLRAIDAAFNQHRGKRLPAGMIAGVISCMRADYELALEYFLGAANNSVIRGVPNEYAAKYGAYVASGLDRDGQSPHKAAGCTVKCWNAFVSDQPVKHLRHRQDEAVPAPLRPRRAA